MCPQIACQRGCTVNFGCICSTFLHCVFSKCQQFCLGSVHTAKSTVAGFCTDFRTNYELICQIWSHAFAQQILQQKLQLYDIFSFLVRRHLFKIKKFICKTLPEAQRTQKLTPRLGLNLATTWRHLQ